ncbi:glycosyltransferase [Arthrobacter sp. KK5.5]|uniref:glycosyltransferase n=1 Tax=Arthrobacter sp. KK5.5 TaxID=3373084 RepID=UPI003EE54406
MTRLCVVVPVLDDADHLAVLLRLLAAQTRPANQVVVVDNGCSDASARIARTAGAEVVVEPARGIPAAAARGYDAADGDIVVRCDADTRPPADWLERIAAAFDADPRLDALTGPGTFYDLPRRSGRAAAVLYAAGYFLGAGSAIAAVPLWGSNMAFRSRVWERVGPLVARDRQDVHDDLDLSCRLGPDARVRFDARLRVGVAGRMFHSRAAAARRFRLAARTLRLNWTELGPGGRWVARTTKGRKTWRGKRA